MSERPRISFYGSSLVSAYWNGAATYYRGIVRGLSRLGYDITFFEPDAFERQAHRDMDDPEWARVVVYDATDDGVREALDDGADSEVIVKASGVGVFDELLEAEVIRRRQADQLALFWDVDAPATLGRMRSHSDDPFRGLVPEYDLVLTYGGGPPVVDAYEQEFGARECIPIYNAFDPDTHHPVAPDERFVCDLAFLGNRLPDREARVEEFFLRPAAILSEHRFLIGGSGWQDKTMPPNVRSAGHVYTPDHNAFNCTPRAVLNVSRADMAACGYSPATRVFEAVGAGACLITDDWVGVDQFLEPGREVLTARDGAEVAEHLRRLTPERAQEIGDAARARALREHTYVHRAAEVDEVLRERLRSGARRRREEVTT